MLRMDNKKSPHGLKLTGGAAQLLEIVMCRCRPESHGHAAHSHHSTHSTPSHRKSVRSTKGAKSSGESSRFANIAADCSLFSMFIFIPLRSRDSGIDDNIRDCCSCRQSSVSSRYSTVQYSAVQYSTVQYSTVFNMCQAPTRGSYPLFLGIATAGAAPLPAPRPGRAAARCGARGAAAARPRR